MKTTMTLMMALLLVNLTTGMIMISEVELNPQGSDSNHEWVELYCNECNLTDYYLENSDGEAIALNGTLTGYQVINFTGQWLDNTNEHIALYHNGTLVETTPNLTDSENDAMTWSKCVTKWQFVEGTPGVENACNDALFIRGDANMDGQVDIADVIVIAQERALQCDDAGDSNDDGMITLDDALYILAYLFSSGIAPSSPYPLAGYDLTEDSLTCEYPLKEHTESRIK